MITSIRSTAFSKKSNQINKQNSNTYSSNLYNTSYDSISFSGKQIQTKLSKESIDLVQNFAKKLKLNKIYKFNNPNVEKFQMTSIETPKDPASRFLILQYSEYSKENMTKHLMCVIKNTGEIIENGNPVKDPKEINIYEQIVPALINLASKELKVKLNMS